MDFDAGTIAVIAHRGASGHAPEHTLAAYDLALQMGAHVLELDVRLTADGQPVVVHDETLLRTAGDPRRVSSMRLRELRLHDCALGLEDVFEHYRDATRYLIDLKCHDNPIEQRTWDVVQRHGLGRRVVIQSFCRWGLRRTKSIDAAIPVARLYQPAVPSAAIRRGLARASRVARAVGPEAASVDAVLVRAAHRHGLRVQPYTVNERDEMDRLLALGVDGLITDFPDRAVAAIGGRQAIAGAA